MGRQLEPEVVETAEEAAAYDELDRRFGEILFQGFALSALHMGVATGRVLDVGTGPGRIALRLARLNPGLTIDGIDLSQSMLALATANAARAGVSGRVRFSIGDAKEIPFPDATFDMVICHNMLPPATRPSRHPQGDRTGGQAEQRHPRARRPPASRPADGGTPPPLLHRSSQTLRRLTYGSFRAGLTLPGVRGDSARVRYPRTAPSKSLHHPRQLERAATPLQTAPATSASGSLGIRLLRWPYVSPPRKG